MEKSVIALIGPSGSGKSSIGRTLARRLKWRLLDTDRQIERLVGLRVSEIFQTLGEAEFRKQETLLLDELARGSNENMVLSTGGGLPVFGSNWEKLESFAIIVYLTAPLEVLVTRLSHGEERPLLGGSSGRAAESSCDKEVELRLGKLIAERESIYNRARYKIDTSTTNVEQLTHDIIAMTGLVIPQGS